MMAKSGYKIISSKDHKKRSKCPGIESRGTIILPLENHVLMNKYKAGHTERKKIYALTQNKAAPALAFAPVPALPTGAGKKARG